MVSGADHSPSYFDEIKYLDWISSDDAKIKIDAFSVPEEFYECDGYKEITLGFFATQQPRFKFGMSYRTKIGNDLLSKDYGYKIHLIYNAIASPTSRTNTSTQDRSNPTTLSWVLNTIPPTSTTRKPTAHLIVDSTKYLSSTIANLENILYGTTSTDPRLPSQSEFDTIMAGG